MYYLFSVLTGILIAVMIVVNGELGASFGLYTSTAIIHLVGLVFVILVLALKREPKKSAKKLPPYLYIGGILGVGTIVFNNLAFGKISVSAILALGLLGQSLVSIIVDQFGWFQMKKVPFSKRKLVGLSFVLLGIFTMITLQETKQIGAITVALLTGLTVVLSRTINAKLAQETSPLKSTAINYVIGFSTATVFVFTAGRGEINFSTFTMPANAWIYTGGLIGVATVMLLNITVRKVSSFYLTLMLFVGQVFTGIVIDIILTNSFSANNLIGGILVAVGLSLNVWFDRKSQSTQNSKEVQGIPESAS